MPLLAIRPPHPTAPPAHLPRLPDGWLHLGPNVASNGPVNKVQVKVVKLERLQEEEELSTSQSNHECIRGWTHEVQGVLEGLGGHAACTDCNTVPARALSDLRQACRTRAAAWSVFLRARRRRAAAVQQCTAGTARSARSSCTAHTQPLATTASSSCCCPPDFGADVQLLARHQPVAQHVVQRIPHLLLVLVCRREDRLAASSPLHPRSTTAANTPLRSTPLASFWWCEEET